MVCRAARAFLEPRGFIELHSAKLQAAATESGAYVQPSFPLCFLSESIALSDGSQSFSLCRSVFKLDYFGRTGCLAQRYDPLPQLPPLSQSLPSSSPADERLNLRLSSASVLSSPRRSPSAPLKGFMRSAQSSARRTRIPIVT
jgi:hypothetical protein